MGCPYGNPECPNPDKPAGEGVHARCLTRRPRWSVCIGGYPNGWESPPVLETDDPAAAISSFETVRARLRVGGYRYLTVAIFDDNGEGEPLDPDAVIERLGACGQPLYRDGERVGTCFEPWGTEHDHA